MHEIESLSQFEAARSLRGACVQSVDLSQTDVTRLDPSGAVFLGCTLTAEQDAWLRDHGALLFPALPHVPVNPYRSALYTIDELYNTPAYADSLDGRAYAWMTAQPTPPPLEVTLAQSLHDHAIADAQAEFLATVDPATVVGIMGGHAAHRGSDAYRATAQLAHTLAGSGRLVASGGGPGAMEAANLGARLASTPWEAVEAAIDHLATVPSFRPSIDDWAHVAREVLDAHADAQTPTLAIPTWFYGHEPPNLFATHVAKYFSNALREDTLLACCRGGIVFLPGAAGTVQELFQATTAGYYAPSPDQVTPLVLVGREQWTQTLPAWPLLSALAADRALAGHIHLVDDVADVPRVLGLETP